MSCSCLSSSCNCDRDSNSDKNKNKKYIEYWEEYGLYINIGTPIEIQNSKGENINDIDARIMHDLGNLSYFNLINYNSDTDEYIFIQKVCRLGLAAFSKIFDFVKNVWFPITQQ